METSSPASSIKASSEPKEKGAEPKLAPLPTKHRPCAKHRSPRRTAMRAASDGQNLFFLGLEQILDPLDLGVRQLLNLVIRPLLIVG
ncbi:hypothetical protein BH10ACI4_BH10ACI4_21300 [soil metagenome]